MSFLQQTFYFLGELPRITREQWAPRAVNKLRCMITAHERIHIIPVGKSSLTRSPVRNPGLYMSTKSHVSAQELPHTFVLQLLAPVAGRGFSWWRKIILIHTKFRKTGRIMNLFWYYASEKGGRGTSCPHIRWQPLLCRSNSGTIAGHLQILL